MPTPDNTTLVMKQTSTYSLSFSVLLILGLFVVPAAHAQMSFWGGVNFNQLSDIKVNSFQATFKSHTGWNLGLALSLPLGPLTFRPGARYMNGGPLYKGLADAEPDVDEDDFDINVFELPVDLLFHFNTPAIKPYIVAGPVIRFPLGTDVGLSNDIKSPSMAGGVGVGIEVPLGKIKVIPEVYYTFGLSRFIGNEFILGETIIITEDDQRLNTAMIRLGIGL